MTPEISLPKDISFLANSLLEDRPSIKHNDAYNVVTGLIEYLKETNKIFHININKIVKDYKVSSSISDSKKIDELNKVFENFLSETQMSLVQYQGFKGFFSGLYSELQNQLNNDTPPKISLIINLLKIGENICISDSKEIKEYEIFIKDLLLVNKSKKKTQKSQKKSSYF